MANCKKLLSAFLALLIIASAVVIAPASITASAETGTEIDPQHAYIDFSNYTLCDQTKNNSDHRYRAGTLSKTPWSIGTEVDDNDEITNKYLSYAFNWPADKSTTYDDKDLINIHTSFVATNVKGATLKESSSGSYSLSYYNDDSYHIVLKKGVKYRISFKYKMSISSGNIRFFADCSKTSQNLGNDGTITNVNMLDSTFGVSTLSTGGTGHVTATDTWSDFYMVIQPTADNLGGTDWHNYLKIRWGVPSLSGLTDTDTVDFSLSIDDLQIDTIGDATVNVYNGDTDTEYYRTVYYAPACAYNEHLFSTSGDYAGGILSNSADDVYDGEYQSISESFDPINMAAYGITSDTTSTVYKLDGIYETTASADPLVTMPAESGGTYYAKYTSTTDANAFTPQHIDVDFENYTIDNTNNMKKNIGGWTISGNDINGWVVGTTSKQDELSDIESFYKKQDPDGNWYLNFDNRVKLNSLYTELATATSDVYGYQKYGGRDHRCSFIVNAKGEFTSSKELTLVNGASYRIKFRYRNVGADTMWLVFQTVSTSYTANANGIGTDVTVVTENGGTPAKTTRTASLTSTEWTTHEVVVTAKSDGFLRLVVGDISTEKQASIDLDNIQVDRIDTAATATITKITDGVGAEPETVTGYAPACAYNEHLFSTTGSYAGGIWNSETKSYESIDTYLAPTETEIKDGVAFNGLYDEPVDKDGHQVVYLPATSTAQDYYARYGKNLFTDEFNYGFDRYYDNTDSVTIADDGTGGDNIVTLPQTADNDSVLIRKFTGLIKDVNYKISFALKLTENTETNIVGYAGVSTTKPTAETGEALTVTKPSIFICSTDNPDASFGTDYDTGKGVIKFSTCYDWATYNVEFVSTDTEAYFYIENSNQQAMLVDSITLVQSDGASDYALSDFEVPAEKADTVNVLMLGNSYTVDATRELGGIIKTTGKDLRVARWTLGSTKFGEVRTAIEKNSSDYTFSYYTTDKGTQGRSGVNFKSVINMLAAQNQTWDYLVIQAATNTEWRDFAKDTDLAKQLKAYADYLNTLENCENCKVIVYGTWAASASYIKSKLSGYYNDQADMHNDIMTGVANIESQKLEVINMEEIFNEIRNDSTLNIGDNLNRDGFHLNNIGASTVGLTLYEYFTGDDATTLSWEETSFAEYTKGTEPVAFTTDQIAGVKEIVHSYFAPESPVTTGDYAGVFAGSNAGKGNTDIEYKENSAVYEMNGIEYTAFRVYGTYQCPVDENGVADPSQIMVDGVAKELVSRTLYLGNPADGDVIGKPEYKSSTTNLKNVWKCDYSEGDETATVTYSFLLRDIIKDWKDCAYAVNTSVTYKDGDEKITVNGVQLGGDTMTPQMMYESANVDNSLAWFTGTTTTE